MKTTAAIALDILKQVVLVAAVLGICALFIWDPAQTDAQSAVPAIAQNSVDQDIQETKRTYTGQLEEYRQLHQQFIVAQQQFKQSGTLTSLETAVQATQKVTAKRDQVLLTYLRLLELELERSQGIEIGLKDQAVFLLAESAKAISRHQEQVVANPNRQALVEQADQFATIEPLYTFTTQFVKKVLTVGQLRVAYDQAQGIFDQVKSEETTVSEVEKTARDRAVAEVELSLANADQLLTQAENELLVSLEKATFPTRMTATDDAFVVLTQITNYLQELLRMRQ